MKTNEKSSDRKEGVSSQSNPQLNNTTLCGVNKHRLFDLMQKVNYINRYAGRYDTFANVILSHVGDISVLIYARFINGTRTYVSPADEEEVGWYEQLEEHRNHYIDFGLHECQEYVNRIVEEIKRRETDG